MQTKMPIKKLLAVSSFAATLLLSACGDNNEDKQHADDPSDLYPTNVSSKILCCINHESNDPADSRCYEGTFIGAYIDPNNQTAMPAACRFTYRYKENYGEHHLEIDGVLSTSIQTRLFLVQKHHQGTRTTFQPDSTSTTKIVYQLQENTNPNMSAHIENQNYHCSLRSFTRK